MKIFDIKFFETQKGSLTKFFGNVRQNRKIVIPPILHIIYKSVVDLMFAKKPLKTRFKTVVSFLTVCKSRSKYLSLGEKYAGASRLSCSTLSFSLSLTPPADALQNHTLTTGFQKHSLYKKKRYARN